MCKDFGMVVISLLYGLVERGEKEENFDEDGARCGLKESGNAVREVTKRNPNKFCWASPFGQQREAITQVRIRCVY